MRKYQQKLIALGIGAIVVSGAAFAHGVDEEVAGSENTDTGTHMGAPAGMEEGAMVDGMLTIPEMDPARGRALFASKGCVVCHSVNGVGGEDARAFSADDMAPRMNPFAFAARMWSGSEAMVMMQREELGSQIELTGQELADIIAFVHSRGEQAKFSHDDIPPEIDELMHGHDE